jgi:hypothetical protein
VPFADPDELGTDRPQWAAASGRPLTEAERARRCGLSLLGLRRVQTLLDERNRNSWELGDLLVKVYGPGSGSGISDGSRSQLSLLAEEVGCSVSLVVAWRSTAGAWPKRERRSCSWSLHSMTRALPDRIAVLGRFLAECERSHRRPTCSALTEFLDRPLRAKAGTVERIEALARRLTVDELSELIDHLASMLFSAQIEDAA